MKSIQFSRHAKRRMKLYHISEQIVRDLLQKPSEGCGHHELIETVEGWRLPIKVVYNENVEQMMVITAYPVKRGVS